MKLKTKKKVIPYKKIISIKTETSKKLNAKDLNIPENLRILNLEQQICNQNSNKIRLIILAKIKKRLHNLKKILKKNKKDYYYIKSYLRRN